MAPLQCFNALTSERGSSKSSASAPQVKQEKRPGIGEGGPSTRHPGQPHIIHHAILSIFTSMQAVAYIGPYMFDR
eukprot:1160777-Pelagomonas_calceolata.AAC.7